MDPNLFHLNWERTAEVLVGIIIMAFLIERALAVLFETNYFINRWKGKSLKELIAFVVAALACWYWDFDALSMIFLKEKVTFLGVIITGGIVAGGSKASIALFHNLMDVKSTAQKRIEKEKAATQSSVDTIQPAAGATQAAAGATQPAAGATQPAAGATQPAAGATQPAGTAKPTKTRKSTSKKGGETQ